MESATVASDKGSTTLVVRKPDTKVMYYGYSKTDGSYHNARNAKGGTPLPRPLPSEPVRASGSIIISTIFILRTMSLMPMEI